MCSSVVSDIYEYFKLEFFFSMTDYLPFQVVLLLLKASSWVLLKQSLDSSSHLMSESVYLCT